MHIFALSFKTKKENIEKEQEYRVKTRKGSKVWDARGLLLENKKVTGLNHCILHHCMNGATPLCKEMAVNSSGCSISVTNRAVSQEKLLRYIH